MGMIPFIIHSGINWLPYLGTGVNWDEIVLTSSLEDLDKMKTRLDQITETDLIMMRKTIISLRDTHFTYDAYFKHLQKFMKSGYLESDLRCDNYTFD
jgi:hypothetical protein